MLYLLFINVTLYVLSVCNSYFGRKDSKKSKLFLLTHIFVLHLQKKQKGIVADADNLIFCYHHSPKLELV